MSFSNNRQDKLISKEHAVKIRWKILYCAEGFLVALAPGLPSIKRLTNSVFLSGSTSRIYTRNSRKNKRPLQPATTAEAKTPIFKISVVFLLFVWQLAGERGVGACSKTEKNLVFFIYWYLYCCERLAGRFRDLELEEPVPLQGGQGLCLPSVYG